MASDPQVLARLRQRKLVQWALAYLAGSWTVLESVGYVADQFGWPALVGRLLVVAVGFGFLVTLVLAWYHGEKGRQRVSGPELVMIAALLLVAGATVAILRDRAMGSSRSEAAPEFLPDPIADARPSVAVLPFANLSADPSDAFLADGFHEEVLSQLSKIGGLKPISRTSVMAYREPARNVREIARELGVGFVLEGTVRKVLDQLRITVQLVDAARDQNVWTNTFDDRFDLESLLDIQSDIATQIAAALETRLTMREAALVASRPTDNLEAYQAFLRGRYFQDLPHFTEADVARELDEFQRAVDLDPTFALAWMELANAHAQEVFYWTDSSEERKELARAAAEKAMALKSPSPEVHLALGLFHLWLERDRARALQEIDIAEEGLPNNPRVYTARAAVYEVQGRFDEAIEETRKAWNLSPRDPSVLTDLAAFNWFRRRYPEAYVFCDAAIDLAPNQLWPNMYKVLASWSDRGSTPEAEAILESLPHGEDWVIWGRFWGRMMQDRYAEGLAVLSDPDFDWIRVKMWAVPRSLLAAFAYRTMELEDSAHVSFDRARVSLEAAVASAPEDPRLHSALGQAYAGLGRRDDALREGRRAMALLPVSEDAVYGLPYPWELAAIHAMLGDASEAAALLEELLDKPGWVSPTFLEQDFRMDGIRDTPEFRGMMERHRPAS